MLCQKIMFGIELEFDVYRELELTAGIYYEWKVRSRVGGVAGAWLNHNFVYFGNDQSWHRAELRASATMARRASPLHQVPADDRRCHARARALDRSARIGKAA